MRIVARVRRRSEILEKMEDVADVDPSLFARIPIGILGAPERDVPSVIVGQRRAGGGPAARSAGFGACAVSERPVERRARAVKDASVQSRREVEHEARPVVLGRRSDLQIAFEIVRRASEAVVFCDEKVDCYPRDVQVSRNFMRAGAADDEQHRDKAGSPSKGRHDVPPTS